MSKVHQDSHPGVVKVEFKEGEFASHLIAARDFKEGELIATIQGTRLSDKAYSSVQFGQNKHFEFDSDLVYMNHSCGPTAIVDVTKMEVRAIQPLPKGSDITFFYPSTEWDMAQPFHCHCGAKQCLRTIQGAKYVPRPVLRKYYLNQHIKQFLYDSAETHKVDVSSK